MEVLKNHRLFSEVKLKELTANINEIEELDMLKDYCIYVTGAFGRLEANPYSGFDFYSVIHNENKINLVMENSIDFKLKKILEKLNIPGGLGKKGDYLNTFRLRDVFESLSIENTTFANFRMLFLLESECVHNTKFYEKITKKLILEYFTLAKDIISKSPADLIINDILKYWTDISSEMEFFERNDLKFNKNINIFGYKECLKMLFCKRLTCYSFIIQIAANYSVINAHSLQTIFRMKPFERILDLANYNEKVNVLVKEIDDIYTWFLELYNQDEEGTIEYLKNDINRNYALNMCRTSLAQKLSEILDNVSDSGFNITRYSAISM